MMHAEQRVTIARPPDEVYSYVASPKTWPVWISSTLKVETTSPEPVAVGSTFLEDVKALGRQVQIAGEVTEFEAPRLFVYRSTSGPISFLIRCVLEPVAEGTELAIAADYEPVGIFALAGTMMMQWVSRSLSNDLATLKDLLELQGV